MHEFYMRYTHAEPQRVSQEDACLMREFQSSIQRRSALIWGEHCSECAIPACFSSCEYYAPRMDFKCQRFANGIVPISSEDGKAIEGMSISFKKWGKLEASAIASFSPPLNISIMKAAEIIFDKLIRFAPAPYYLKIFTGKAVKITFNKLSGMGAKIDASSQVSVFVIETVNQGAEAIALSFTIREKTNRKKFFQKLLDIPVGHNRCLINLNEMKTVSLEESCLYQIEPAASAQINKLIFGVVDFVMIPASALISSEQTSRKVKCVIWDLDNTLWNGTLVEDGVDGIQLRPEMVSMIIKLDEMGILNSIASKNNYDDAMQALKRFGLDQYFLYPQISWNPKSGSIKTIQKSLNIGMDTLVFIDDQVFERTEVREMLSDIRTYSDEEATGLLSTPAFQITVSRESRERRKMYQENVIREEALETGGDDYKEFLKSCEIVLQFESLSTETIDRVHELSQRTNQLNFSGNRYNRNQLLEIMGDVEKKTCVISCQDRFGHYGIVGFAIVDHPVATLMDLMFSCRIQAKQVEHTFIKHLLEFYFEAGEPQFNAHYRPTAENAQSGKVFSDIGFKISREENGLQYLIYDLSGFVAEEPIMSIVDKSLNLP